MALTTVAIPLARRTDADELNWERMDLVSTDGRPYADASGGYKPFDVYRECDNDNLGMLLVAEQHLNQDHPSVWHLHTDIVLALELLREGDSWIRPSEGYVEVARLRRKPDGSTAAMEIKSEYLRDYLAARGMALRVSYYRQRQLIVDEMPSLPWAAEGIDERAQHERFKLSATAVGEDGGLFGAEVAVFKVWRTDIDQTEDVPVFGEETNENTSFESSTFTLGGKRFFDLRGEIWRTEWVEPLNRSERVRGDEPAEQQHYIVDAGGARQPADKLDHEEVGRWLWFSPQVISALINQRGGSLEWYTNQTGGVRCSPSYSLTHFGINALGLITVYAYDVARLPAWHQRIWAAHNVAPDGKVSSELLEAHVEVRVAQTHAPEKQLPFAMNSIDATFSAKVGDALFRPHHATAEIMQSVSRFRAVDRAGLLGLAKDIARLVADRIEIGTLRKVASPPKGENWGSLKSLEKAVGTVVGAIEARALLAPLFGVYELRLADAHLPSEEIDQAIAKVGIDPSKPYIEQGRQMISKAAETLGAIDAIFKSTLPSPPIPKGP